MFEDFSFCYHNTSKCLIDHGSTGTGIMVIATTRGGHNREFAFARSLHEGCSGSKCVVLVYLSEVFQTHGIIIATMPSIKMDTFQWHSFGAFGSQHQETNRTIVRRPCWLVQIEPSSGHGADSLYVRTERNTVYFLPEDLMEDRGKLLLPHI